MWQEDGPNLCCHNFHSNTTNTWERTSLWHVPDTDWRNGNLAAAAVDGWRFYSYISGGCLSEEWDTLLLGGQSFTRSHVELSCRKETITEEIRKRHEGASTDTEDEEAFRPRAPIIFLQLYCGFQPATMKVCPVAPPCRLILSWGAFTWREVAVC